MLRAFLFLTALVWAGAAAAADLPVYAPAPTWVLPVAIPKTPTAGDGAAVQQVLQNDQTFYGLDGDQFYTAVALRVVSSQGLSQAGNIALNWNPEIETLTIHKLNLIRGDQVIDLLAKGQKFTILRRENNLELAMLDGTLTAAIQPEDLRVGDIIDLAITKTRHDPVYRGRSEGFAYLTRPGVIGRAYIRELWPSSKPIRWRATDGLGPAKVARTPDQVEVVYDLTDAEAPKPPQGAPSRFDNLALLEVSQFASWSDVSALMAPLYRKAATLSASSPLRAEIDKIKAASGDPKVRAAAALHLVQDQTRYVFLGMNFGGYIPADADVTWTRRFGDCKGKTALLLAILQELGIEAQPALVSSSGGDGLDARLPLLGVFDHVLVRAQIGGKAYWLDGTRLGDRGLDDLQTPPFGWALLVQTAGGKLERLIQEPLSEPNFEDIVRLDASAGLDAPAPAHLEYRYRGDDAITAHLRLVGVSHADAERSLREYWTKAYPWISVTRVDFDYDDVRGVMRISMDGAATMDWARNGPFRDFDIGESTLGRKTTFKREPGPLQDAPYAVSYPSFGRFLVTIILPDKGTGFTLPFGPDVDKTVAAVAYHRASRIQDGVVTMEATQRSVAPEFAFSEADSAAAELGKLAETDVWVRSPRGGAAGPALPKSQAPAQPTDAAGYSARGIMFLNGGDYDRAIADFTRAAEFEPNAARHHFNRGVAYHRKGQDEQALADFNQAIRLKPDDGLALLARAEIYLARGADQQASRDFDEAERVSPGDVSVPLRRIDTYARTRRYDVAIALLDRLIAKPPRQIDMDVLLNNRCWLKAQSGRQLQGALADCDASLKLKPGSIDALDSRGFVRLRLGQYDQAIADYDAALLLGPGHAQSLYGRGLAKLRKGAKTAGEADIAAATKIDPGVAAEFAGYGVKP